MAAINPINNNQQTAHYAPEKPELTSLQAKCFQIIAENLPKYSIGELESTLRIKYSSGNPQETPRSDRTVLSGFASILRPKLDKLISAVTEEAFESKKNGTLDNLIKDAEILLSNIKDKSRSLPGSYILNLCKLISSDLEKSDIPYDPKNFKTKFNIILNKSFSLVDDFKSKKLTVLEGDFEQYFLTEMDEGCKYLGSWSFCERHKGDTNEDWYVFFRSHTDGPFFMPQKDLKEEIASCKSTEPLHYTFFPETSFGSELGWFHFHHKWIRDSKRSLELHTAIVHSHYPMALYQHDESTFSRRAEKLQDISSKIKRQLTRDEIRNYLRTEELPEDAKKEPEPIDDIFPPPAESHGVISSIVQGIFSLLRR